MRNVDGRDYRALSLFPADTCQPFSVAGGAEGTEDDRHLWRKCAELLAKQDPRVLLKTMPRHVGMGLDEVLHDLEAEGYAARALVGRRCPQTPPKGPPLDFWPTPQARDHMPAHQAWELHSSQEGAKGTARRT